MTDLEQFQEELKTKTKGELLQLLYTIKRPKDPERHKLVEEAFRDKIRENMHLEEVKAWVQVLPGSFVRVRDYSHPVRIVEAQLNSRGNAAIIKLEGEERTRYFSYGREEE